MAPLIRLFETDTSVLIQMKDGEREGWGEVSPLPGWSKESLVEAKEELMRGEVRSPSVWFGMEMARRTLEEPMELPPIPLCGLMLDPSDPVDPEWKAVKLKVGHLTVEEAIAAVEKISLPLRVDINRMWPSDQVARFCQAFPLDRFDYIEEPGCEVEHPIALDETFREGCKRFPPNLKALIYKPTLMGPLPEKGFDLIMSSSYEGDVGLYGLAYLAVHYGMSHLPQGLGTFLKRESKLKVVDGMVHFPPLNELVGDVREIIRMPY